ncbi:uncharacterized protein Hap1MRO34_007342 isoform 1-T3 [Clarias gariepinus]
MPQALSKCRRPSHDFTSGRTCADRLKDKKKIRCNRKRFRCQWKTEKANFVPVVRERAGVLQEEDWEKEIEEFSLRTEEAKEKEMPNNTPYDAEEELKVALSEMSLYSVPCAPRPDSQHYIPSTHHTPPIKWIRYITRTVTNQFADAED